MEVTEQEFSQTDLKLLGTATLNKKLQTDTKLDLLLLNIEQLRAKLHVTCCFIKIAALCNVVALIVFNAVGSGSKVRNQMD